MPYFPGQSPYAHQKQHVADFCPISPPDVSKIIVKYPPSEELYSQFSCRNSINVMSSLAAFQKKGVLCDMDIRSKEGHIHKVRFIILIPRTGFHKLI